MLIWDSYRCHLTENTKNVLKKKKIHSAIIPGGTTGLIQAPDISWNRPFKQHLRDGWDTWMNLGEKSLTKAGNVRAMDKAQLCDLVVQAWTKVSPELIKKSFVSCGQAKEGRPEEVSCLTSEASELLPKVKEIWDINPETQKPVELEEIPDIDELENNELLVDDI